MRYDIFESLCKNNHIKPIDVSRATGIAAATLSSWKKGNYYPKTEKLKKIADYFGVTLEYLTTGTSAVNVEIESPELKQLIEIAKDCKPEDIKIVTEFLKRLKGV